MTNVNLYLDDFRMPGDSFNYTGDTDFLKLQWQIVRNYKEFVEYIENLYESQAVIPSLISFDHDLADTHYGMVSKTDHLSWDEYYLAGDREMTGYDCAKWLVDFCTEKNLKLPEYKVHSMNSIGKKNIISYLSNFKKFQDANR